MKKYLLAVALVTTLTPIPNVLAAGQRTLIKGGVCITHVYKNASSVFSCQHIGDVTISQIYEKGWKIVSSYSQQGPGYHTTTLIIEQQG